MNASVNFSTNFFLKDGEKINHKNEKEFSFRIRDWLLSKFERDKYTFHLFPNGNFSIEIYPEVVFMIMHANNWELNAQVEHWYIYLEKEKYQNEEVLIHSNEITSKKFFLNICQKIDGLLKDQSEISEICWQPSSNILDEFKVFAEICPDEI
ncbi:hypothetical protein BH10ACI1_BH10ACI1_09470 [soil metagenome]